MSRTTRYRRERFALLLGCLLTVLTALLFTCSPAESDTREGRHQSYSEPQSSGCRFRRGRLMSRDILDFGAIWLGGLPVRSNSSLSFEFFRV
jgi:hypothetical protein